MNTINLVVGDWSNDGHGRTDTITISTNLSRSAVQKAYKAGAEVVGVDLTKDVCRDYEDHYIDDDVLDKFRKAGLTQADVPEWKEEDLSTIDASSLWVGSEIFAHLYCFIVKKGAPAFEFTVVENKDLNIGGYGLFE